MGASTYDVEHRVPMLPFSSEVDQLRRLLGSFAVYRVATGLNARDPIE